MKNDPRHASTQQPNAQHLSAQGPGTQDPGQSPGTQNPDQQGDPQARPDGVEAPSNPPVEFPGKPQRDMPVPDRERASGAQTGGQQVEGEGSYTASRNYRDGLESSIEKGDTERLASEAAEALDGAEGQELRQAEQQAKQGKSLDGAAHHTSQRPVNPGKPPAQREQQPTSQR